MSDREGTHYYKLCQTGKELTIISYVREGRNSLLKVMSDREGTHYFKLCQTGKELTIISYVRERRNLLL